MIDLRPYQNTAIDEIRHCFTPKNRGGKGLKRVILCLPTGGGKTVVFSAMTAKSIAKKVDPKILILTDRLELLQQAGGTLSKFGIDFEPIRAKRGKNDFISEHSRVYVGMVESVCKRLKDYPWLKKMDWVIIDECHKGNFKKYLNQCDPDTFVIGATATPIATSKKDPLRNYYQDIVCPVQIPDLLFDGFLCPAVTYSAKLDRSKLKKDFSGDYSDASQMEVFAKRSVYDGLFEKWNKFCPGQKTVVFNVNVKHSLEVVRMFQENGVDARHIDGETPKVQREETLAAFKRNEFPVLCNCGILCAGWDEPSVTAVVVNRATNSKALWLQMCGRGSRLYPGKNRFVILDMGENYRELGLWESEIDWREVFFQKHKIKKDQPAPVKQCPECGALIRASSKVCKECSYQYPEKEQKTPEQVEFEEIRAHVLDLLKIDKKENWHKFSVKDLLLLQEEKNRKVWWVVRILHERNQSDADFDRELQDLAELKGYHAAWVERAFDFYRPAVVAA